MKLVSHKALCRINWKIVINHLEVNCVTKFATDKSIHIWKSNSCDLELFNYKNFILLHVSAWHYGSERRVAIRLHSGGGSRGCWWIFLWWSVTIYQLSRITIVLNGIHQQQVPFVYLQNFIVHWKLTLEFMQQEKTEKRCLEHAQPLSMLNYQ